MHDTEKLHTLIRTRRTVKPADYTDETVARDRIEAILEAANWAPNHGKTEPWRFRVYAGAGREQLADAMVDLYERTTPADQRRADKIEKLAKNPLRASHAIALFTVRHGGGPATKIPAIEEVEALACAVQNMQLAAHADGIGAFWSTGPMTYNTEAACRVFDLEPDWTYLGVLFLGIPASEPREGARQAVADKTEWIER